MSDEASKPDESGLPEDPKQQPIEANQADLLAANTNAAGATPPKGRPLIPPNGNDRVMTPDLLALDIVKYYHPSGTIVEPAAGKGAFLQALGPGCDWYEIDQKRDFLQAKGHWDWLVTNPPYSQFRPFLQKALSVADNVVFLCLENSWALRARRRDVQSAGFGVVEHCECPTPPSWPQFGFCIAATWLRRGWTGSTHNSRLPTDLWAQWAKTPKKIQPTPIILPGTKP